jgi:hypothetical protein
LIESSKSMAQILIDVTEAQLQALAEAARVQNCVMSGREYQAAHRAEW